MSKTFKDLRPTSRQRIIHRDIERRLCRAADSYCNYLLGRVSPNDQPMDHEDRSLRIARQLIEGK